MIGDGALTGGMAYEALNNAGSLGLPLIVVLNDNEMSIAPNVGAIPKYLNRVRTDERYHRAKDEFERILDRLPRGDLFVELGKRMKDSFKEFVYHTMIWEELGFTYIGPVDGHNMGDLIEAFEQAKQVDDPVFVHCVTAKGKGFDWAESDPFKHHAAKVATPANTAPQPPKFQDVFGETLTELAAANDGSLRSPRQCRMAPACCRSPEVIRIDSSTSGSPNSTRSPSPPVWRHTVFGQW